MHPSTNNPIGLSTETVFPFAKRHKCLVRFGMGVLGLFLLSLLAFAYAETPYAVLPGDLDTRAFPSVELILRMGKELNVVPSDLTLAENGAPNHGPLLLIPPGEPVGPDKAVKKIDFFILLDKSGNSKPFESTVKSNLRAMAEDLALRKVDAKLILLTVGGSDSLQGSGSTPFDYTSESKVFNLPTDSKAFSLALGSSPFEDSKPIRVYGLSRLDWMASQPAREGSQKVTLIVGSTPFYDVNPNDPRSSEVYGNLPKLGRNGNLTFFLGQPLRQLFSSKGKKAEDFTLNRIPGGYLGGFSSDLTLIYKLLSRRSLHSYKVRYFSNLMPSEASGASVSVIVGSVLGFNFRYPPISVGVPDYTLRQQQASMGNEQPVEIAVDPKGQWIDMAEVYYYDKANARQYLPLIHSPSLDGNGRINFTGSLPKSASVSEVLKYDFSIHTPFNTLDGGNLPYIQKVVSCDPAITLEYQLHLPSQINWKWSGEAVNKATEFILFDGKDPIKSFTGNGTRNFQIPVGDCDYYQIVTLGVKGPDGTWAYSCPVEANFLKDTASDGPITEKEGVERLFLCLDPKKASSLGGYTSGKGIDYTPSAPMSLSKMLYHLTGIKDPASQGNVSLRNYYRAFYFMATFFSRGEVELYGNSANPIPRSLLFKAITGANQSKDFANQLKAALKFMNALDFAEGA